MSYISPIQHHYLQPTRRTRAGLQPLDQVLARVLARQADHALHLGFHRQAEHLAKRAEELRGAEQ